MIRVMIIDDHPSMRSGLLTVLQREPGLVAVGGAGTVEEAWPLYNRTRPDLVMLDFHLPGESSLRFAHELKRLIPAPQVLLHSAHAGPMLALCGMLAGVDGVLGKGVTARELFDAVRTVANGHRLPADASEVRSAAVRLPADDRPLVAMLMDGATYAEIADALRVSPKTIARRIARMLDALEREPLVTEA